MDDHPQPTVLTKLLTMLAQTHEHEPDCGHVYDMMDEAAELKAQGVDLSVIMPELEQHLAVCRCCCSEFELLMTIVQENADA